MKFYNNKALAGASAPSGYTIDRSLRFRSSASAYLSRTPASAATSSQKMTVSAWVKRGSLTSSKPIFDAGADASADTFRFTATDNLQFWFNGATHYVTTTAVFRDPSAWYHVVASIDTTQATAANRIQLYVNGVLQTSVTASYPAQNYNFTKFNVSGQIQYIGYYNSSFYDGYITEFNVIDGQALDPTYFGEYNADTGVWQPIKYTGSYGTNGFYLNFSDNSTTTTLGYDTSGNGNNWTANNISVTSGVTYDSMTDVPTLTDEDAANYATLNKLSQLSTSTTISNANLSAVIPATSATGKGVGTIAVSFGKWYWETTYTTSNGNYLYVGMGNPSDINPRWLVRGSDGEVFGPTTSGSATAIRFVQGDVIGIALDADNGKWFIRVNGTWQLSADPVAGTGFVHSGLYGELAPRYENATSGATQTIDCNFGQRPFVYTPPTGFKSLNTYNLPDSTVEDGSQYFNTVTYTGDGTSSRAITGVGLQPDFVWIKSRSNPNPHDLIDSVRGPNKFLRSNATDAEATFSFLTSFDSDGFTLGTNDNDVNGNGYTYVAWNWKANGSGVSNTDGIITSTVSANTTAGFSIVTYTGTGSAATVGHGLGTVPDMLIIKNRDNTRNWAVWHSALGGDNLLNLNTTGAVLNNPVYWGGGNHTSTVFELNTSTLSNESGLDHVAYCFADVEGYSKFGSYTGNGSADGPFVYTGFRPRWVMIKSTSSGGWSITDTSRDTYNLTINKLEANSSLAEAGNAGLYQFDVLSNGFKLRQGAGTGANNSSQTYIYMAFAENPFKNALAR